MGNNYRPLTFPCLVVYATKGFIGSAKLLQTLNLEPETALFFTEVCMAAFAVLSNFTKLSLYGI